MILETVCVGPMQANCYILAPADKTQAIIIDPGAEEDKIRKVLDRHRLRPACIINTHGHIDHIGCNDKFGVEVYVHRQDLALLKNPEFNLSSFFGLPYRVNSKIKTVEDKDEVGLAGIILKVIHVPGHTPGGISLLLERPKKNILSYRRLNKGISETRGCGGRVFSPTFGECSANVVSSGRGGLPPIAQDSAPAQPLHARAGRAKRVSILFTGDSLFCAGIGRTDFPQADSKLLLKSIKEKLLTLDEDTLIYPGHGPTSTIANEKRHNPFLMSR